MPERGQSRSRTPQALRSRVGTIDELEQIGEHPRAAKALVEYIHQPLHPSAYGRDPDGLSVQIIWRIHNTDWTYADMWRRPLDFEAARQRWGGERATGSAAGEAT